MSQIEIRSARESDVADVARMLGAMLVDMAAHGGDTVADDTTRARFFSDRVRDGLARPDSRYVVATDLEGHAVGAANAEVVGRTEPFTHQATLHISTVYVEPSHRGRGIGQRLIENLVAWGREQGCAIADLNVLANSPARAMYERLGFAHARSRMTLSLASEAPLSSPSAGIDPTTVNELAGYRSRAARALVLLHESRLREFVPVWRAAKQADVTFSVPDHASYQSLEHLLVHVLGAARHYMEWMTQMLELPHPEITPVPGIAIIEAELDDYVEHLLDRWRVPLADVAEERLEDVEHRAAWGQTFTLDGMLEHAAMHPMRHAFQLAELTASAR